MSLIKFIFASLFKNDVIIEDSKKKPWWLAIVFVIVSCVIALVPSIVNTTKINGSDIITTSTNYNLDYSLKTFTYEYLTKNGETNPKIKMFIGEDGTLTFNDYASNEVYDDPIHIKYGEETTLSIQYVPEINNIESVINHLKVSHPIGDGKSSIKPMLIFGKDTVLLYVYDKDATCTYSLDNNHPIISTSSNAVTSLSGTYEKVKEVRYNFNNYFDTSIAKSEAYDKALIEWASFFDEAYKTTKTQLVWQYIGVFGAIEVGMVLIMSLSVFLISRTKNSIQKFSYPISLKMTFFASLSPAIISLIIGFMISSMQSVSFILLLTLRMTWLAMKATSPNQSGGQAVRK